MTNNFLNLPDTKNLLKWMEKQKQLLHTLH